MLRVPLNIGVSVPASGRLASHLRLSFRTDIINVSSNRIWASTQNACRRPRFTPCPAADTERKFADEADFTLTDNAGVRTWQLDVLLGFLLILVLR